MTIIFKYLPSPEKTMKCHVHGVVQNFYKARQKEKQKNGGSVDFFVMDIAGLVTTKQIFLAVLTSKEKISLKILIEGTPDSRFFRSDFLRLVENKIISHVSEDVKYWEDEQGQYWESQYNTVNSSSLAFSINLCRTNYHYALISVVRDNSLERILATGTETMLAYKNSHKILRKSFCYFIARHIASPLYMIWNNNKGPENQNEQFSSFKFLNLIMLNSMNNCQCGEALMALQRLSETLLFKKFHAAVPLFTPAWTEDLDTIFEL